ncbi:MAG: 3-dehydroquinate synthase [Acidobacteria bacterium]|nr:3-dehydroquinate synthase [Acidobacteriota bacterium]
MTLTVELGHRSYPVMVGEGLIRSAGARLKRLGFASPPIVVTNRTVLGLHGKELFGSLESAFGACPVITIGDGERFKNHETLIRIYNGLFRSRADRRSWVVAFGGGVVGDIAGYAAATFMRGIPYASIPTTLLAQVDSAIGGKVGLNVRQGKNLIGAFHQPSAVLSDTGLLRTMPARELAAGMFEVIKSGAIRSEPLISYLEKKLSVCMECRPAALDHVVIECARIKAEVVSGDETEEGPRMVLNYGHTVGHALEAATRYRRFRHGEAVGWGMIAAVGFGRELGLLTAREAGRLVRLIHAVEHLPSLEGVRLEDVWRALRRDKKFRGGRIRMVLLPKLGTTEILPGIDPRHLKRFLRSFLQSGGDIGI